MPRVGNKRKKKRTEKKVDEGESVEKHTPRCFVLKKGVVGERVRDLVADFRQVMLPNCAKRLKESKSNRLEDFVAVAGPLGVTHSVLFTSTALGTYMRLIKMPQGPTLTFKVSSFSLGRDIRANQKRPRCSSTDFLSAPLQVLNGFNVGAEKTSSERKLCAELLKGLFPAVDVATFNQAECRRVALFHHENDSIHFRHYSVQRRQSGIQRGVNKLLNPSKLPKLGRSGDLADFILGGGVAGASDSEFEGQEDVPSMTGGKIAVKLVEVGPRLELTPVKAEAGILGGAVLFHKYQTRTPTEIEILQKKADQRRKLQERNTKLEKLVGAQKVEKKRKRDEKEARSAQKDDGEDDDAGAGGNADVFGETKRGSSGGGQGLQPVDNPFGPRKKKSKGGAGKERGTVEIDSRPSAKFAGAGKKRRAGGQSDKGRPGGKGDGGKGGGRKSGGKGKGKSSSDKARRRGK